MTAVDHTEDDAASVARPSFRPGIPGVGKNYPRFRMPLFPRFAPARRRPGLEALERRCADRLAELLGGAYDSREELEAFLEHRTSLWNLLTYADAREDRIELVCAWIDVLFAIDDVLAHAPASRIRQLGIHDLPAVIDGGLPEPTTAFTRAFQRLREQTLPLGPHASGSATRGPSTSSWTPATPNGDSSTAAPYWTCPPTNTTATVR
ncbi:hypothetical protein OG239_02440 [Streptomyces sp. NBC_00868]|uniref:hypothetical protein n=1 Tax=Streptomyces sp. NBC_00868 TaxID=2903683 RepID=UPI00386B83C0|nr:hypothetical protein OG239_02440 [Streptomyces sp. NBC_00868]